MNIHFIKKLFLFSLIISSSLHAQLTKYVNPFIGTGGAGHTFPGATTPFAMVQLSPDTRIDNSWEGCSGYHYSDSIIHGFSHTHLSGTGISDYGDISFMPFFSKTEKLNELKTKHLQAKFSHKNEKASAGYYSVLLDDIPVKIELTATTRSGFQRFTFNEDGYGYIVLNLKHRDELLEGKIQQSKPKTYSGIRISKAWATRQELYFGFEINQDALNEYIVKEGNNDTKLILEYKVLKGQQILVKTGISTVDADAALNNLSKENDNWFFEKIKLQAQQSWEKELSKIEVQDAKLPNLSTNQLNNLYTFYTALYHCMIHPSIMNDVDGRYKGRDGKIHKAEGFNYYTVFSLWDTHRALHPLLNIIDKKRSHDFIITFLKQFEQSGRMPMWELWNNETNCMIGFHSVSVILDAYRKQVITKQELKQLWPAVKAEAMSNRFGLDKFREKGFLSVEDESESVSKTAEYSYDMWCVSEIALELGFSNDEKYFRKYSSAWVELTNPENGFMQPRKNGNWLQNFNPYEVNNNYTEANAWQYSFYHPQSTSINNSLLQKLFKANTQTTGRIQADITGMIGQYAHGNEPSHSYIYLLDEKISLNYLNYVINNFYTNKPDGLIGNEDCGQMSAWYVMSGLGFYQTCPGNNMFKVRFPLFEKVNVTINDTNKISFIKTIEANIKDSIYRFKNGDNNVASISCNFTSDVNSLFGVKKNEFVITNVPTHTSKEYVYCAGVKSKFQIDLLCPIIQPEFNTPFSDSNRIGIKYLGSYLSDDFGNPTNIKYSINDSLFLDYISPFTIYKNSTIKAFTYFGTDTSYISTAHFYKRSHNYSIQLNCKYNKQYTADGDDGIIDGQYGDLDWRKGGWQGYQSQDFEAIIDMKEIKYFNEISANFLQDTRSWILFPKKVEFYISTDNINFTLFETVENKISATDYNNQTQKLKVKTQKENSNARYIKIKATNFGKLPEWHAGKGDDAFIFIDEIEIK